MRIQSVAILFVAVLLGAGPVSAQVPSAPTAGETQAMAQPPELEIQSVEVRGVDDPRIRDFVRQTSGLTVGQTVSLPGGEAIAQAIRSIYDLRRFSDVRIYEESRTENGIALVIEVTPEPTLGTYRFEGIKGRHEDDIDEQVPLLKGRPVRPADLERTKQIIQSFYGEKGYLRTEVEVERTVTEDNRVNLVFLVDRNEKVEVERIRFLGNERFDDGDLRGAMDETRENRWWRFWKGEKFKEDLYEEDLDRVVTFLNSKGYYDARVVKDSVYYVDEDGIGIDVTVEEGDLYHVRNIEWEGNTVFPDRALTAQLGLEEGEPYNGKRLEENLYGNKKQTDILGLYMDRGYMRANVEPTIRVVEGDSLDITLDVREGDVYDFGDIRITGNTKTKDHVIRRELYTVPGQRFSRSAIQESIRRLMQLSYFSQQSLGAGPDVQVDEQDKEADLTYSVEEVGSDQLELSGTWGQFGLVLQLGFQFNNFSAQNFFNGESWRPLPSGDGQKLSLNVRTNGSFFQSYSASFTEPWFRGRPTPVGGSISYSQYTRSLFGRNPNIRDGLFQTFSTNVFFERRLDWPDDKFSTGTTVGYQLYNNRGYRVDDGEVVRDEDGNRVNVGLFSSRRVPPGISQSVTVRQALTRNSLDNPMFPRTGSRVQLSAEVAIPLGTLVQYHKWKFKSSWNVPIGKKFSFGVGTDFGYIGSLTGEPVRLERFEVGGTPFDYSGVNVGTDPIFMRGYPQQAIGPRARDFSGSGFDYLGGRILNKYSSEFRWKAVESQQLQAQPYLFLDAANTWDSFETYNPSQLYRSAGIGVKLFLPIVGMIEFNYGRNFDTFYNTENRQFEQPGWRFQFSLGQGFGN